LDRSDKGALPYITLNGVDVADSHIAIDYLAKKLGKDLDSELTSLENIEATKLRFLCDDGLKWYTLGILITLLLCTIYDLMGIGNSDIPNIHFSYLYIYGIVF